MWCTAKETMQRKGTVKLNFHNRWIQRKKSSETTNNTYIKI